MRIRSRLVATAAIVFAFTFCLAASRPSPARAQVTAADSAAILLETALTFETRDRWDVAEALYRLVLERYASSTAAAVARERLAAATAQIAYGSGTVEAQVWMTLYGAWLGVAVPGAFGADSPEAYGVGLLLGGPSGFLAGRTLARALDLTEGQARAITLGGTWGTWQGFGWREVFDFGVDETCQPDPFGDGGEVCYEDEDSSEEAFTAMIAGGLAGITAGALLAGRDITPGTGTVVNFGALWGTWFGVAVGTLAGLRGDDLLAATLAGGDAGLVTTALLAPGWNVSRSRARLVSISGVLGGIAGAGLDLIVQPDDEKVTIGIPLAGSVLGLGVGILATRNDDPTRLGALDDDGAGALLRLDGGRLALGMPVPVPTLIPSDGPAGTRWRPALGLEVFRASF